VIVGAVALVGLPELLREFADYRLLVYGAALMVMMLVSAPLVGSERKVVLPPFGEREFVNTAVTLKAGQHLIDFDHNAMATFVSGTQLNEGVTFKMNTHETMYDHSSLISGTPLGTNFDHINVGTTRIAIDSGDFAAGNISGTQIMFDASANELLSRSYLNTPNARVWSLQPWVNNPAWSAFYLGGQTPGNNNYTMLATATATIINCGANGSISFRSNNTAIASLDTAGKLKVDGFSAYSTPTIVLGNDLTLPSGTVTSALVSGTQLWAAMGANNKDYAGFGTSSYSMTNSTTFVDTGASVYLPQAGVYSIYTRGVFYPGVTAGIKFRPQFTGTFTVTDDPSWQWSASNYGIAPSYIAGSSTADYDYLATPLVIGAPGAAWSWWEGGGVINATSAGTFSIQYAQQVSAADASIVRPGHYIKVRRL
jgi:hypothetical protein